MLGDEWMSELGFMDSTSVREYINNLVWAYVESIANQIVEGNN
jgi:chemotaxis protein CheY-P-specific phosphatase CheC